MPDENKSEATRPNSDKQSEPQSPVVPLLPQPDEMRKSTDARRNTEENKVTEIEEDIRSGERWLIGISAAGVILNVVIALIYLGQLHQMRRATGLASKANEDAWRLTNCTNRVAINAERPWMGITIATAPDLSPGTSEMVVYFTNSGRRPAKVDATGFANHDYSHFPNDPPYIANPTDVRGKGIIIPNSAMTNSQPFQTLTQERINALKATQRHFFLYAKVEYEDTLTNAKHFTHACWQYLPGFHNISGGFVNCSSYNEVDPEPSEETCKQ